MERRDQGWQQVQQQLQQAQLTAANAQSKATAVETVANEEKASVAKLSGDVADVKTNIMKNTTQVQPTTAMSPVRGLDALRGLNLPAFPPCVYGPQGFTNATFTDAGGKIHFLSQFLYADLILNNQIKPGNNRFPANLVLEYENNLNAGNPRAGSEGTGQSGAADGTRVSGRMGQSHYDYRGFGAGSADVSRNPTAHNFS